MYGAQPFNNPGEKNELRSRQQCTDVPCCIVFAIVLGAFSILYGYGLKNGNIGKLYHGINYQGQVCGVDVPGRPYLYWCLNSAMTGASISVDLKDPVCVSACPGSTNAIVGAPYQPVSECKQVSSQNQINSYKTMVVMNRYCFPDTSTMYKSAADALSSGLNGQKTQKVIDELSSIPSAWPILLLTFFAAVLMGYAYLAALRHCAEVLIYAAIALVIFGFAALGIFLWTNAGTLSQHLPANLPAPQGFGDDETTVTKVLAGISLVLSAVSLCVACCCHGSIDAATAVIETACEAIFEMSSLLLAPIIKAIAKGIAFLILAYGFFALVSTAQMTTPMAGNSEPSIVAGAVSSQVQGIYRSFDFTGNQKVMLLAYCFVAFWIECFLNALYQFIIAYAMAEYYTAHEEPDGTRDVGCCALFDGFSVGMLKHCGSLAFGSFIVAIFWTLQLIVSIMESQNKQQGGNRIVACLFACLQSILQCFKSCVEFLNKNAYVDIAMNGRSDYCTAAKQAIAVIAQLPAAMAILNGATLVFTFFGCLLIGVACAAFSFAVTTSSTFSDPGSLFFVDAPVVVAVFAGGLGTAVGYCFMLVFDMASDALLFYYGLDCLNGQKHNSNAPRQIKDMVTGMHEQLNG